MIKGILFAAVFSSALLNWIAPAMAGPADGAGILVTSRPLRVGSILTERDVHRAKGEAKGIYLTDLSDVVGKQTRIALYKGRPLRPEDLGSPTVVRRNQIVTITFQRGGLSLRAEGRALDKGALGERIRVLNIDSRRTVFATITGPAAAKAQ
jgi:flagella basal body P-ring formation protein FlgA